MASSAARSAPAAPDQHITKIIFSSAAGTMIEWYDFYIFGSLASTIASKFYQTGTPLGDIIAWLAAFAVGFIVRPFGAIFFGRIGDLIGRKYTFMVTMTLMGVCTFLVGLLPTQETIGPAAGIILIGLRILQGLALGGEYGGAATYIAEHAPQDKRGFYTSFIQITATLGLFVSLGVILTTRLTVGPEAFAAWGWRIPFLVSIFLIAVSLYIRSSLKESPLFLRLKSIGQTSKNPLKESFTNPVNLRYVILALFGATMGQGVVWYTGQFYALYYLQNIFKVPLVDSNLIIGVAILFATPLFILTGWLSDRIGRKWLMLSGMALGALTYYPIYSAMYNFRYALDPLQKLVDAAGNKIPYEVNPNYSPVVLGVFVFIQMIYVTLAYGPIAAYLVEMFPTRIRYTSMSLPYHLGNGVFGGMVPIIGLSLIQGTGNNMAGLYYPIAIAAICFIVGAIFLKETKDVDITADI
ncbi:major facilitator family transporter [Oscillochloris trichoides DG-6]|uniref:Major facilitator family transporter n=1 Tax=Oscillochloris trichoides DG-6 TaxID=765420 RepID=E1IIC4_9CHLR|nr:major facilitator family transporter [Oscillochloris trichoides DG-6]